MAKKISINQKFDRAIEKSNFNFFKNFKFFAIVSLALIIIGAFMCGFLGFNLGSDLASLSTITVYTNAEGYTTGDNISSFDIDTAEGYDGAVKVISDALASNGTSAYSIEKTTINITDQNILGAKALEVSFYNDRSLSEEEQQLQNQQIKTALMQAFGYSSGEAVVVEGVTDAKILSSYNNNMTIVYSAIIALIVSILFAIIYLVCRYERAAFVTGFFTIMHDMVLLLALLAITRVPISLATIGVFAFTFFMSVINLIVFYSKSKEMTAGGAVDKNKVSVVANEVTKSNIKFNFYLYLILFILAILIMAFSSSSMMLFTGLSLLLAVLVNYFSAQFILNGFYGMVYKPVKKNRKLI